jgi:hypothetical protein
VSFVSLIVAALLALPAPALAAIYKWTDETGRTHYSNRPPDGAQPAKDVKVVVEDEPAPPAAPVDPALLERIAMLERQVAAQQAPAQYPPPQYYTPPPAPPEPDYANYYGYGQPYYYYPPYYYPPYSYSYIVYPGRHPFRVHRPVRPAHPIAAPPVHRGSFHGGFAGGGMRRR